MSTPASEMPPQELEQRLRRFSERKMEMIADIEKPIDLATSAFAASLVNPKRPAPVLRDPSVAERPKRADGTTAKPKATREQYFAHAASPVPQSFGEHNLSGEGVTEVLPGRVWVIPAMFTPAECDDIIAAGEVYGMEPALKRGGADGLRTSNRTPHYCCLELSAAVMRRLPETLIEGLEQTRPGSAFRGIHPNWRIAKYAAGQHFAAHYDQADSLTVWEGEGDDRRKARLDSWQTLLISLSDRKDFEGGATRIFPSGQFDEAAVDVELPRGWALVFDQKLLHAGLAPRVGMKYIAQAGLLRDEPVGVVGAPSTFRFAAGLALD